MGLQCTGSAFARRSFAAVHRQTFAQANLVSTLTSAFRGMASKPVASEKWWKDDDVAVVTGANKGIGFEIARQLGAQGLQVVVTSRDEGRGADAMKALQEKEANGRFQYCQADITDSSSILKCAQFLEDKYGKITILVNNAGIAYKGSIFGADEAQNTIDCNLKGTREMCNAVLPLMPEGGRIVNVCSMAGKLRQLKSSDLKHKFQNPRDDHDILQLADGFVQAIRDNNYEQKGYSSSMYGMSKLAEVSYTMWLARHLKAKGITVNAVCPGYVDTDMTSHRGVKAVADGADTPVWVALLPPSEAVTESFFQERQHLEW